MTDEKWGTYGAHQSAARAMLVALQEARAFMLHEGAEYLSNPMPLINAAIAQAKAAGITTETFTTDQACNGVAP